MTSAREWDAGSYEAVGGAVHAFGHALLDRLVLEGDEAVLDAGCGSGEVTAQLLSRLPNGRLIGVDGSAQMIDRARAALGDDPRLTLRVQDLLELDLDNTVDVVFSSAVFHWIPDHERLFANLHRALRPGGVLLAQCGGQGNIADVRRALETVTVEDPFAEHLAGWAGPWNFSPPHTACERLEAAGFTEVRAVTHLEPVSPEDPERFMATLILGGHLDRLPEDIHTDFVRRVIAEMERPGQPVYVRLTLSARRATIGE
jgi:trans-aconitate 2-methyltransferase